ncbi:ABC transporter ATP-binding protein [Paenibacillus radicis (ex Gao et al. 2016)]|uniref:ABC transporter ATP-binding protein n=1 Tax=Paenibacillus radicis (ex Gao et al. 2016) TaxID=1737354 RepID=A0A917M289_9BACL|nr:ABC transporter ATP-binding protein [Paenibacillus radicis (ex Gao et al. 2016)]GGG73228.1 ABC transporter ATP-binding protein [Paenibacillus radicis (ex Gao et al. 2016)]
MTNVVEVKQLTKTYGSVQAVKGVSFSLEPDKIYGLLGRNGAGKTTIMHMLTAQLFATSGEMKIFGESPYENNNVLTQVCFIKESLKYPDNYKVIDVLELSESLFPNWDREYAYSLLQDFQLPLKRRIKKLSRGMHSSLGIIVGLASRAPLTIFDEPYLGLDAVARSLFYDRLLEDYSENPRTVILSTHLIDEVSRMLEHVIVVDNGSIILNEDSEELRSAAYSIAGASSIVEPFLTGKKIIAKQPFGALVNAAVMGRLSAEERKKAESLGLELAPVSLQQLIIHLTNGKLDAKEADRS